LGDATSQDSLALSVDWKNIECLSLAKSSLLLNCSRFGSQILDHKLIGFFVIFDLCIMFSNVLHKEKFNFHFYSFILSFFLVLIHQNDWILKLLCNSQCKNNVVYENIIVLCINLLQRFQDTCQYWHVLAIHAVAFIINMSSFLRYSLSYSNIVISMFVT
jgi:hypothetical protein